MKREYCHEVNDEELRKAVHEACYAKAYAIAASGILGIATAERVDGQGKGVKELRFSFRDLDVYLPKLIRAGNRVAVCEPNQTGSGKRV